MSPGGVLSYSVTDILSQQAGDGKTLTISKLDDGFRLPNGQPWDDESSTRIAVLKSSSETSGRPSHRSYSR